MDFSKFVGKTVSQIELNFNYDGEIGIIYIEFDDGDFLEIEPNDYRHYGDSHLKFAVPEKIEWA